MGQGSCFPHQKLSSLVPLLTNLTDVTRQYDTEPDVVPVFWVRPFILEWHASNLTRGHSHGGGCLSETIWNGPGLISSKKRTWRSAFWGFGKFLGHTSGLYKKRESRSGQNGPPIRCHSPWRSLVPQPIVNPYEESNMTHLISSCWICVRHAIVCEVDIYPLVI